MKKSLDPTKANLINKPPNVKYVKKAKMWVRTTWNERGEQKEEWSIEKPNGR